MDNMLPSPSPSAPPAASSPSPAPPSMDSEFTGMPEESSAPSIMLPPDVATRLKGGHQCQPGDRYTMTVSVKDAGEDGSLTLEVPPDAEFLPADSSGEGEDSSLDRFEGPTVLSGIGKSLQD